MRWAMVVVLAGWLHGCRDERKVVSTGPAVLAATPAALEFPDTWEGEARTLRLEVANLGGEPAELKPHVPPPFFVDERARALGPAQSVELEVRFVAPPPATFSATLSLGTLDVELRAASLPWLRCETANPCVERRFDVTAGACVDTPRDGQPCTTRCTRGQCAGDVCVGTTIDCDDGDACTVDACDDSLGCRHVARECLDRLCHAGRCVADAGCTYAPLEDGTRCGVEDCDAVTAEVCIAGECVERARPEGASCVARWISLAPAARWLYSLGWDPRRKRVVMYDGLASVTWAWDGRRWRDLGARTTPPTRLGTALAFDGQGLLLFGGLNWTTLADTWTWTGLDWVQRHPAHAPSPRVFHAMTWQPPRGQVLLFGGSDTGETWEWDGQDWHRRFPPVSPSPRSSAALVWDEARGRAVLFGGFGSGGELLNDTWEWDGATWALMSPAHPPPPLNGATMSWDGERRHIVLVAQLQPTDAFDAEWEWDGVDWTPRPPTLTGRRQAAAVWDPLRQEVVLYGGSRAHRELSDTWVRRNGAWALASPGVLPEFRTATSLASDTARRRVVLFGGTWSQDYFDDTWEWDGTQWLGRPSLHVPPGRAAHAMTWDALRQRTLLFGGEDRSRVFGDTWEWDGTDWTLRPGSGPSARLGAAMAFDERRGRVVLFGGDDDGFTRLDDTWEWDGASWARIGTTSQPPARASHAMAWDPQLQRVVLMGGIDRLGRRSDVWTWDGAQWTELLPPLAPPARRDHGLATDRRAGHLVLVGGSGNFADDTWDWSGGAWRQPALTTMARDVDAATWDPTLQRVVAWGAGSLWVLSR